MTRWCSRLNSVAGAVVRDLKIAAATDITGFGIGGHALEMALASNVTVVLHAEALPLMPHALEYARDGLIPAGSHLNRKYWACSTRVDNTVDEALTSLAFDAQTSGGLLLAVAPELVGQASQLLLAGGDLACEVGEVTEAGTDGAALILR